MAPADDSDGSAERTLMAVRREIDSIDDALHDLLMRRAGLVAERVTAAKGRAGREPVLFRPGREISILRRLIARHRGPLAPEVVVRVWREIISALTRLQGPFSVVAYAPPGVSGYLDLARENFGGPAGVHGAPSIASVLTALERGRAQVAVLPLPEDCEGTNDAWWRHVGAGQGARRAGHPLQVLARLPFLVASPRAAGPQALVVGRQPFDPSGDDRGYLLVETDGETSRARVRAALEAAGLAPLGFPAVVEEKVGRGRAKLQLVETPAWIATDDPRLRRIAASLGTHASLHALGGYAQPIALTAAKRK